MALNMRHDGSGNEEVGLSYRVGNSGSFVEAGRTTIRGGSGNYLTRDLPLMTMWDLQGVRETVTFRIHGWDFGSAHTTFRIDSVELFGIVRSDPTVFSVQ